MKGQEMRESYSCFCLSNLATIGYIEESKHCWYSYLTPLSFTFTYLLVFGKQSFQAGYIRSSATKSLRIVLGNELVSSQI